MTGAEPERTIGQWERLDTVAGVYGAGIDRVTVDARIDQYHGIRSSGTVPGPAASETGHVRGHRAGPRSRYALDAWRAAPDGKGQRATLFKNMAGLDTQRRAGWSASCSASSGPPEAIRVSGRVADACGGGEAAGEQLQDGYGVSELPLPMPVVDAASRLEVDSGAPHMAAGLSFCGCRPIAGCLCIHAAVGGSRSGQYDREPLHLVSETASRPVPGRHVDQDHLFWAESWLPGQPACPDPDVIHLSTDTRRSSTHRCGSPGKSFGVGREDAFVRHVNHPGS